MDIIKSTNKYESWFQEDTSVIQSELALKHQNMAEGLFPFFRATFYRWIQLFDENIEGIDSTPIVLGVGDLHVENFGTWRDIEGRLVWGVNDFDESYFQPYTNDLIRLTVSAHIAIEQNHLKLEKADACDSILKGYTESIIAGGSPYVLNGMHNWLRETAIYRLKEPAKFWDKLNGFEIVKKDVPDELVKTLLSNMPGYSGEYKIVQRIAGLGSLGRQRLVLIANWEGGFIAREAKAYVPSSYTFQNILIDKESEREPLIIQLVENAVRCPDPYFLLKNNWIIRRLAPDCSRIELNSLPLEHDELKLLYSMGWETANIHLGSSKAIEAVKKDLMSREKEWLHKSSEKMLDFVQKDFLMWQKYYNEEQKRK